MGDPAKRKTTYEEFLAVPDRMIAQIIHGNLVTLPRPASPHARAASVLGIDLGGAFDRGKSGPGGWVILYEPELHLHGDILVPDLAGWRRERMPQMPVAAAFELPPDWICEVLSPSTEAIDRSDKLPIYARERVAFAWIVDPLEKTLEVLVLNASGRWEIAATHAGEALVRAVPFDAIELELGALWAR